MIIGNCLVIVIWTLGFNHSLVAPAYRQAGNRQSGWLLTIEEWFVYALRSLRDGNLYIGISRDPDKRLKAHNKGVTSSTRSRRPFVLIFQESCNSLKEARGKEKYYKSGFGREILKTSIPW